MSPSAERGISRIVKLLGALWIIGMTAALLSKGMEGIILIPFFAFLPVAIIYYGGRWIYQGFKNE